VEIPSYLRVMWSALLGLRMSCQMTRHDVHPVTNTYSLLLPMPLMPGLQQDYLSHAAPAQMLGQSSRRQSHPPTMASTHTPLLQRAFSEPPSRYNRLSSPIPYGSDFGSFNIVQVGGNRIKNPKFSMLGVMSPSEPGYSGPFSYEGCMLEKVLQKRDLPGPMYE